MKYSVVCRNTFRPAIAPQNILLYAFLFVELFRVKSGGAVLARRRDSKHICFGRQRDAPPAR